MSTTRFALLTVLVTLLSVGLLWAQGGAAGTILGSVKDNSGAVVTNASVDVTNTATGVTKRTATTSSGDYTLPYLQPGTYRVTVQAAGFQKFVVDNISLVVGQQARIDATMKPGAVSESVEVMAAAVTLDTDSAAVSQLVSQRQVDDLPLNATS